MSDETVRLSIDLEKLDHQLLKLECSRRGLTPKIKLQEIVIEWIEDLQDSHKIADLEEMRTNERWVCLHELRRRMAWDAL